MNCAHPWSSALFQFLSKFLKNLSLNHSDGSLGFFEASKLCPGEWGFCRCSLAAGKATISSLGLCLRPKKGLWCLLAFDISVFH